MGKAKKSEDLKEVVVELKVSMHCDACERKVAKIISKFKGVEKFTTEMKKHKVVVKGKFDPQKLLKKLKKKTGKIVEIVKNEKEEENETPEEEIHVSYNSLQFPAIVWPGTPISISDQVFMTFSDENPNACSMM